MSRFWWLILKCLLLLIASVPLALLGAFLSLEYPIIVVPTTAKSQENNIPLDSFKPRLLFYHGLNASNDVDQLQLSSITPQDFTPLAAKSVSPKGFTLRSHPYNEPTDGTRRANGRQMPIANDASFDLRNPFPNTTDKETVVNLAKMTSNAYVLDPSQPDWVNISLPFNSTKRFGWKGDGLRGQVFATDDNSTVVVSFKGTSVDPRDPWRNNDRLNDNRLFSCCCGAQNPWGYAPVCDCQKDVFMCNSTCLTQSILQPDIYYTAALDVMHNMSALFPKSAFWVIGHSLGGSLASLVGLTFDIPAVAFEAPPERLPAQRLGLDGPRRQTTYHFGNTGDPVFMGACNGFWSSCSAWGFAFESQCFTGRRCVYDTVADKGWHLSITNHRINYVIDNVLQDYETVAECHIDDECADCFNWKYS